MLREFDLQEKGWDSLRKELNKREADTGKDVIDTVSNILKDVEENGDKALYAYTEKFDKLKFNFLNSGVKVEFYLLRCITSH